MKIQILGMGCAKCQKLTSVARQAADDLKLTYEVVKVTDPNDIVNFGVMMTPALAVDGTVKIAGRIPTVEEMKTLLQQ
ncbi:MAG TPA: thioredoxin family protein [Candidatus Ozemobacteraceae bacterium]|nr:thioredoxin family protein [Candidatus Ozemobacteraceae bacterium]